MAFKPTWGVFTALSQKFNSVAAGSTYSDTLSCDLDGANDRINFGSILNTAGNSAFSFAARLKQPGTSTNVFMSKNAGTGNIRYSFDIQGTQLVVTYGDGTTNIVLATAVSSVPANTWKTIHGTYNGNLSNTGWKLYIDGVLQSLAVSTGSISNTTAGNGNFYIGVRHNLTNHYEDKLDGLAVWDGHELSQTDITTDFNSGVGYDKKLLPTNPTFWVDFENPADDMTATTGQIIDEIAGATGTPENTSGTELNSDVSP